MGLRGRLGRAAMSVRPGRIRPTTLLYLESKVTDIPLKMLELSNYGGTIFLISASDLIKVSRALIKHNSTIRFLGFLALRSSKPFPGRSALGNCVFDERYDASTLNAWHSPLNFKMLSANASIGNPCSVLCYWNAAGIAPRGFMCCSRDKGEKKILGNGYGGSFDGFSGVLLKHSLDMGLL